MTRTLGISLAVAFAVGVVFAPTALRAWRNHQALRWIVDDDPARRRDGWAIVLPDQAPPTDDRLAAVAARLADASDAALLDAAAALTRVDRWSWSHLPRPLLSRHLRAGAATADEVQHAIVLDTLELAPLDLDLDDIDAALAALALHGTPAFTRAAADAVAAWAGPARLHELTPHWPDDEPALQRWLLIQSWGRPVPAPPPLAMPDVSAETTHAWFVHALAHDPTAVSTLNDALTGAPAAPIADLLRWAGSPQADAILAQRADAGDRGARFAQQALSAARDSAVALTVAADRTRPRDERRLALWRLADAPGPLVAEVLDLPTADPDGSVVAAALLAERELDTSAAAELADRWIHSLSDDDKRAGAILAALTGTNADALVAAHAIEDIGRVRTQQRLALWTLGHDDHPEDSLEFAHRASHDEDGDFHAEAVLCRLLAGDASALALVTSTPTGAWTSSVRRRALLIERFAPPLFEVAGRPIGGTDTGLRLYFERLDALRTLLSRRLEFDPVRRVYGPAATIHDGEGAP